MTCPDYTPSYYVPVIGTGTNGSDDMSAADLENIRVRRAWQYSAKYCPREPFAMAGWSKEFFEAGKRRLAGDTCLRRRQAR